MMVLRRATFIRIRLAGLTLIELMLVVALMAYWRRLRCAIVSQLHGSRTESLHKQSGRGIPAAT